MNGPGFLTPFGSGQSQIPHRCRSCPRQTGSLVGCNCEQTHVGLGVASLAVNESILLALLRGN